MRLKEIINYVYVNIIEFLKIGSIRTHIRSFDYELPNVNIFNV